MKSFSDIMMIGFCYLSTLVACLQFMINFVVSPKKIVWIYESVLFLFKGFFTFHCIWITVIRCWTYCIRIFFYYVFLLMVAVFWILLCQKLKRFCSSYFFPKPDRCKPWRVNNRLGIANQEMMICCYALLPRSYSNVEAPIRFLRLSHVKSKFISFFFCVSDIFLCFFLSKKLTITK